MIKIRHILFLFCITSTLSQNVSTGKGGKTELYQKLYNQLFKIESSKFKRDIVKIQDLSEISKLCSRDEFFYSMNKNHIRAVQKLKHILDGTKSVEEALRMSMTLKNHPEINPQVWYYALESYLQTHPDTQSIHKKMVWETLPDKFINADYLQRVRRRKRKLEDADRDAEDTDIDFGEKCVVLDESYGADNGVENRLWYWREDIMVNAYHWYWHLTYLLFPPVKLDRAGELFYYFHEGIMARYNVERLANGLEMTRPFNLTVGAPIEQGYRAHLTDQHSGYPWSDREPNTILSDVDRPAGNARGDYVRISVKSMVTSQNRILEAIDQGFVVATNGSRIELTPFKGIDILSDIIVATNESVNPNFYGINRDGLHNSGHDGFGLASDPRHTRNLPPGPMDDFGTSMRDVIFYPWHENIRNIFDRHKDRLAPYAPTGGDFPLHWVGVHVKKVFVTGKMERGATVVNQMETFWNTRRTQLTHGLDFFQNKSDTTMCVKHLDHQPFTYKIEINSDANLVSTSKATVRIFIAPGFGEDGNRLSILEQRKLFFPLDTFTTIRNTILKYIKIYKKYTNIPGQNTILRKSTESAVTIPWQDIHSQLEKRKNNVTPNCGCGWPHHLLLPKGTKDGTEYDLFVMVTNGEEDEVIQSNPLDAGKCNSAYVYCGLVNQKYPDARPMGYPFDRLPYSNWGPEDTLEFVPIPTLEHFMSGITNMKAIQVRIFHRE